MSQTNTGINKREQSGKLKFKFQGKRKKIETGIVILAKRVQLWRLTAVGI